MSLVVRLVRITTLLTLGTAMAGAGGADPGGSGTSPEAVASSPDSFTAIPSAGLIPSSTQPAPPFEITRPGSYHLAGDRLCAADGILVSADDVTIDLGGFTIAGPDTGATIGILMDGRRNVEIHNGTVRDFGGRGIHEKAKGGPASGKRIIGVRVLSNGGCGICLGGDGLLVRDCLVADNGGSGICAGGIITGNVVLDNATGGIACGDRALVSGNTVSRGDKTGIFARSCCTIRDNVVSETGGTGIYTEYGSLVTGNVVTGANKSGVTGYAGIKVIGDCIVRDNAARSNRIDNFLVLRSGAVVEGNLATAAADTLGRGYNFGMKENHYSDNCTSGNQVDFDGELPVGTGDGGGNVSLPHREPATVNAPSPAAATPAPPGPAN